MKYILALSTIFLIGNFALASGYGGYDQEETEVTPIDLTLTGVAASTCEESKASIQFSLTGCEESYETANDCPCIKVDKKTYCQNTTTVVCYPQTSTY